MWLALATQMICARGLESSRLPSLLPATSSVAAVKTPELSDILVPADAGTRAAE